MLISYHCYLDSTLHGFCLSSQVSEPDKNPSPPNKIAPHLSLWDHREGSRLKLSYVLRSLPCPHPPGSRTEVASCGHACGLPHTWAASPIIVHQQVMRPWYNTSTNIAANQPVLKLHAVVFTPG